MIRFPLPSASREDETKVFAGTTLNDWMGVSSTYAMFWNSALEFDSRTALTHLETGDAEEQPNSLNYTQLFAEITRAANLLSRHGAPRSNSVALLLPNLTETHLFLWAAGAKGLLAEIPHRAFVISENGSRGLHVTISCGLREDIEATRGKLDERLLPFLFRWKLQATEDLLA